MEILPEIRNTFLCEWKLQYVWIFNLPKMKHCSIYYTDQIAVKMQNARDLCFGSAFMLYVTKHARL